MENTPVNNDNTMNNTNTMPDVAQQPKGNIDTYSYKGWMNSDSFVKRCFGVMGHYMMGQLMILAGIMVLAAGIMLIVFLIQAIAA